MENKNYNHSIMEISEVIRHKVANPMSNPDFEIRETKHFKELMAKAGNWSFQNEEAYKSRKAILKHLISTYLHAYIKTVAKLEIQGIAEEYDYDTDGWYPHGGIQYFRHRIVMLMRKDEAFILANQHVDFWGYFRREAIEANA